MQGALTIATEDDAEAVADLRNAVAEVLTDRHGIGHWSSLSTAKGVRASMKRSSVYVAKENGRIVGTLVLQTRKPWAIDRRWFTQVTRPLYLVGMAVEPARQRHGLGRRCIEEAVGFCRNWPADSLCLDAYDADAGAGAFYQKCGFSEVGRATYKNTPLIYFEMLVK
jgi:GNAT superfamily N-acetyltransferase